MGDENQGPVFWNMAAVETMTDQLTDMFLKIPAGPEREHMLEATRQACIEHCKAHHMGSKDTALFMEGFDRIVKVVRDAIVKRQGIVR